MQVRATDKTGTGAVYTCTTNKAVLALVETLLKHGTLYVGDKITRIEITRGKSKS